MFQIRIDVHPFINIYMSLNKENMPIHRGRDSKGPYYQWGNSGKKYYYISGNKKSRENALSKAERQRSAIYSSGWREK